MQRRLTDLISVAPQIRPEDVPALKQAGFVAIINNRPDGEEPGQPSGESIRAAAAAARLGYTAIPVTHAGIGQQQLDQMGEALAGAGGPVLAFCRSGTRSANLWALAEAKAGRDPDALVAAAREAGYDLAGLRPTLAMLAGGAA